MSICLITEAEYLTHANVPAANSGMHDALGIYSREVGGKTIFGLVLLDKTDKDFSFVVLTKDEHKHRHSPWDLGTDHPTQDDALGALTRSMNGYPSEGSRHANFTKGKGDST